MQLTGFAPVIADNARVLILGSMPGQRSLQLQQYYAHPQNSFWKIMEAVCGESLDGDYPQRLSRLKLAGFALWDVLQHCERSGSLDANIVAGTEVANDLPGLLESHQTIRAIAFNGKKAEQAFKRHITPMLDKNLQTAIELVSLPSTSPANAVMNYKAKLELWKYLNGLRQMYA
jgi:hypoxanthine-DNA glycosylase